MSGVFDWVFSGIETVLPLLIFWVDIVLKSLLIALVPIAICLIEKYRSNSSLKFTLWIQTLVGISLLPVFAVGLSKLDQSFLPQNTLFSFSVSAAELNIFDSVQGQGISALWVFLIAYLLMVCALILRLGLSYLRVKNIAEKSDPAVNLEIRRLVEVIQDKLGVNTPIQLKYSELISSPFSFGWSQPQIILPLSARDWSNPMLEDVLIHEISHIKRKDWLAMTFSHLVTYMNWFNPLCWFIKSRLDEAAENCCDLAVLNFGKSKTEYADNLVCIAKQSNKESPLLAQMLVNKSKFHKRIKLILEGKMTTLVHRSIRNFSAALVAILVLAGAGLQVIAADADRIELSPISAPTPYYPRIAADEGLEGWVQLEFTVESSGSVDPGSIVVVDESPAGIFTRSAIAAAESFQFSPRIENGVPVDVPGVQYVYRYVLN